ncbi:lebercilin-like protein isoform X2 [Sceloporus undulatus]|uniref:lebercilin-like protein isoform X2 n=1 Tax=Sceloporus undulatus TaxID=8520 RepID=UPI001C4D3105|nr:lebercilin-like protein isoform X2 [Sceloporus undulatus]
MKKGWCVVWRGSRGRLWVLAGAVGSTKLFLELKSCGIQLWVTYEGVMASDDFLPHFIANEDNKCKLCTESGSPSDSPSRLSGGTQSNSNNKVNNSKPSSQCGHFQLDYSNDFHANISRRAGSSSSCSEQISCGRSQNYYDDDFQTYSSETSRRSCSRSSCSSTLEQPDTKKEELPKKKSGKDHPAKGGKTLPKRKKQQKINCDTSNVINSQKNNVARRLLSASLHNIKELKNEVSVLNNKLEAANMENQILKKLQLRHLKAISKYENAEINLPDLIAKHCGEVETLRALLRKSQEQEWNASRKLREVEAQLLKTKDNLQALQKLSEDKHLTEREELKHKVTALTERMVANDKKIQDLEKQLALNNTSFIHQLAVEKKKTLDAQAVTTNLKMEIKLLNQKIKEKEREIAIRNIYANRMLKDQQKKGDSESVPEVNVSISVQVDMNLESLPFQKHERKQSAVLSKEAPTTKDVCAKDKMNDVNKEMEPKPEAHQTEKLPVQEVSDRTCSELLEDISLSNKKYFKCENIERQKNRRDRQGLDLLKEEFEKLCTEESLQSTHDSEQKENNLGEAVTENQENENKRDEPKEVVSDKLATVIQRHKTPSKLKKQYIFTEAVENLHQGFPSTRRLSNTSTTGNSRQANTHPSDITEFKGSGSTSSYEPSFGNTTNTKQGISVHSEDRIPTVSAKKKNTLMQELFGTSSILQDNNLKPNFEDVGKGKKSFSQNEKFYEDISYMHDSFQCGDSKQTPIKGFDTVSFLENLK